MDNKKKRLLPMTILVSIKQPSSTDYWEAVLCKTMPFTIRAQIINTYLKNLRRGDGVETTKILVHRRMAGVR